MAFRARVSVGLLRLIGTIVQLKMRKRKNKKKKHLKNKSQPRQAKQVQIRSEILPHGKAHSSGRNFSIVAYLLMILGGITVILSALDGLKSAVELMPAIDTLATYWLNLVEAMWRPIVELMGFQYFPESGSMMSCFVALMLICFSALVLEDCNPKTKHSSESRARRDWPERVVTMLIAGSFAALSMVALIELLVFENKSIMAMSTARWWHWSMHFIALLAVPVIVLRFGWKLLAEVAAVGVLCGVLFFVLSLPHALQVARNGERAIAFYRAGLLEYSFVMLPWRIACLMAMAKPRFLLAQLLACALIVALIIGISWVVPVRIELRL